MSYHRILLRSYAKLNLGLHVLGKQEDGYHEIRTLFQSIAFHDLLEIERIRGKGIQFHSNCPELDPKDNLVVRAAEAVCRHRKVAPHFRFHLTKRLPLGGGLGGGSSNAASTIWGLGQLWGRHLSVEELLEIGGSLGSDICFFFLGGTALGLGRGSEVYPLPDFPARPVLLVQPPYPVHTPGAYQRLSLTLTKRWNDSKIPVFCSDCLAQLSGGKQIGNDFERVVYEDFPALRGVARQLENAGAWLAGLTGSGSVLFGIFKAVRDRNRARAEVKLKGARLIPTRVLTRRQYLAGRVASFE
jgi:4-diphosphocytidyl-2-C-methyl-D-erythritol kinase